MVSQRSITICESLSTEYKQLKKVLHIQFEGQYLPQYNVAFSVTGLILLWRIRYPAFNIIGVHFQWDEY